MSHKLVYICIPASDLKGTFSKSTVENIVERKMSKYVEGMAKSGDAKCDWYIIGGQWSGVFAAAKGARNVIAAEGNTFAYEKGDLYNTFLNGGHEGPYLVEDREYVPVNGGLKEDIAWIAISELARYAAFKVYEGAFNGDARLAEALPLETEISEDGIYEDGTWVYKKGETYSQWIERLEVRFFRCLLPPAAYIDKTGVWHGEDDREVFDAALRKANSAGVVISQELISDCYFEGLNKFIADIQDGDCIVALDCHE